jgi:hypothetical protein
MYRAMIGAASDHLLLADGPRDWIWVVGGAARLMANGEATKLEGLVQQRRKIRERLQRKHVVTWVGLL